MVKARELIDAIKNGNYEADEVDAGDLAPYLSSIDIITDQNNRCRLKGNLAYSEDDAKYGTDPGRSEIVIMGVTFSNNMLYADDLEIDGDIEYAEQSDEDEMSEEDELYEVAQEYIQWPCYDGEEYPFDESSVTPEDIYDELQESESDCTIFALNKDNEVCGFSEDELELGFTVDDPDSLEAPEKEQLVAKLKSMGYTYLSCDDAFKRLSTEADIDYETCYYG